MTNLSFLFLLYLMRSFPPLSAGMIASSNSLHRRRIYVNMLCNTPGPPFLPFPFLPGVSSAHRCFCGCCFITTARHAEFFRPACLFPPRVYRVAICARYTSVCALLSTEFRPFWHTNRPGGGDSLSFSCFPPRMKDACWPVGDGLHS